MAPPRALWVPFELGRPLGAPDDVAFQHRVIAQWLDLFQHARGPVLEDFPEDAPAVEVEGWACPIPQPPAADVSAEDPESMLNNELLHLQPWYEAVRRRRGRSTVGLSGESIEACASRLTEGRTVELEQFKEPRKLKFAIEDLKAYYLEAAIERPDEVSRKDSADWLWNHTHLGAQMKTLAKHLANSPFANVREFALRSLVPREQLD